VASRIKKDAHPTSVRLSGVEREKLLRHAARLGLTQSEAARAAIVEFIGHDLVSAERRHDGHLVSELGQLNSNLRKIGGLHKLAMHKSRPDLAPDDIVERLRRTLAAIEAAGQSIVATYSRKPLP
jgi:hypothetical protein